jgi:hypothetical protein
MRVRVPMRSTGADQLVVVSKSLQWGWSEGVGSSVLTFWSTSDGRSQEVRQGCYGMQLDNKSRMTGDCHVRICESLGVKFPRATRLIGATFRCYFS